MARSASQRSGRDPIGHGGRGRGCHGRAHCCRSSCHLVSEEQIDGYNTPHMRGINSASSEDVQRRSLETTRVCDESAHQKLARCLAVGRCRSGSWRGTAGSYDRVAACSLRGSTGSNYGRRVLSRAPGTARSRSSRQTRCGAAASWLAAAGRSERPTAGWSVSSQPRHLLLLLLLLLLPRADYECFLCHRGHSAAGCCCHCCALLRTRPFSAAASRLPRPGCGWP